MKKVVVALALLFSVAARADSKDPILGEWDWVYPENPSAWGPQVFTFQADGTVLENGKVTAHWKRTDKRKYSLVFEDKDGRSHEPGRQVDER